MRLTLIVVAVLVLALPARWVISGRRGNPCGDCTTRLVAELRNSEDQDAGTVTFQQFGPNLRINLALKNLPPGQHAVYLHANPVCSPPDFPSIGPHFNPDNKEHGTLNPYGHHNGDLPNVLVGADRTADATFNVASISLGTGYPNSIYRGESLVIHDMPDDLIDQPDGFAGKPIACGIVATAN